MPKILPIVLSAFGMSAMLMDINSYVEESAPVEQRPVDQMPALQPMAGESVEAEAGEKALREIFAANKFVEAKAFIEEQLAKANQDPDYLSWLRRQMVIVKTALAWTAVQKHDCRTAEDELRGLDMQIAPPLASKALGYCAIQSKDWATAEQYLEFYTEAQNHDAEGYMLLSSVKEARGEFTAAIDLNQRALGIDASSEKLALKAKSLDAQQEESQTQTELSSGPIRLRFQAPTHFDLAPGALAIINETLLTLNTQLGLEYPESTIEVVFHSVDHFERITHGPAWASALYDGEVRVPIPDGLTDIRTIAEVLRHEITHAVLDEQTRKRPLPSWFQEGLAQIAECPNLCWTYTFDATTHRFLPLDSFNKSFLGMSSRDAHVAYKQSRYLMTLLKIRLGIHGLKEMILQLREMPSLDSESLLEAAGGSFKALYDDASQQWDAQRSLN